MQETWFLIAQLENVALLHFAREYIYLISWKEHEDWLLKPSKYNPCFNYIGCWVETFHTARHTLRTRVSISNFHTSSMLIDSFSNLRDDHQFHYLFCSCTTTVNYHHTLRAVRRDSATHHMRKTITTNASRPPHPNSIHYVQPGVSPSFGGQFSCLLHVLIYNCGRLPLTICAAFSTSSRITSLSVAFFVSLSFLSFPLHPSRGVALNFCTADQVSIHTITILVHAKSGKRCSLVCSWMYWSAWCFLGYGSLLFFVQEYVFRHRYVSQLPRSVPYYFFANICNYSFFQLFSFPLFAQLARTKETNLNERSAKSAERSSWLCYWCLNRPSPPPQTAFHWFSAEQRSAYSSTPSRLVV